jgi:hypothetical protein
MNHGKIGLNTGSPESFTTAAAWIRQCSRSHFLCAADFKSRRRLPTRLLDVGDTCTTSQIHIVLSETLPSDTKYLALSHCWGAKPVCKLTTSSEFSFYEGIEVSKLSKTFQDAIYVTEIFQKEFGVRYLWIDSLCIIQDSVEDWQSESAVMGEVYQNAFCTIAATASEDGTGGLFFERDPLWRKPCLIPVVFNGLYVNHFYCADQYEWAKKVSRAPLNGRSWVLQERLLSHRVLHFAADQLYWECAELEASEVFPVSLPLDFGEKFKNWFPQAENPMKDMQATIRNAASSYSLDVYVKWEKIVQAYTSGNLTKVTDKLVALSGVAREIRRRAIPQDTYLAGLWRHDLIFELLWDLVERPLLQPQSHSRRYVAPSWSWASRTGAVKWERENWLTANTLVKAEDASVTGLGLDDMGQLSSGYIRLSGVLIRASLRRVHQPGSSEPRASLQVGNITLYGATNRADDGFSFRYPIPEPIYCLALLRGSRNSVPNYRGLFLTPSGAQDGRFRRYGTFTAECFESFFLVPSSTVSLEGEIRRANGRCVVTII